VQAETRTFNSGLESISEKKDIGLQLLEGYQIDTRILKLSYKKYGENWNKLLCKQEDNGEILWKYSRSNMVMTTSINIFLNISQSSLRGHSLKLNKKRG